MQVSARSCIDCVVEASLKVLHHTKQKQEIAEDSRCRAYRDFPAPCCMFCCIYTVERFRIVKLENVDECFDIHTKKLVDLDTGTYCIFDGTDHQIGFQ